MPVGVTKTGALIAVEVELLDPAAGINKARAVIKFNAEAFEFACGASTATIDAVAVACELATAVRLNTTGACMNAVAVERAELTIMINDAALMGTLAKLLALAIGAISVRPVVAAVAVDRDCAIGEMKAVAVTVALVAELDIELGARCTDA